MIITFLVLGGHTGQKSMQFARSSELYKIKELEIDTQ
jgi:hypothetical protein